MRTEVSESGPEHQTNLRVHTFSADRTPRHRARFGEKRRWTLVAAVVAGVARGPVAGKEQRSLDCRGAVLLQCRLPEFCRFVN